MNAAVRTAVRENFVCGAVIDINVYGCGPGVHTCVKGRNWRLMVDAELTINDGWLCCSIRLPVY